MNPTRRYSTGAIVLHWLIALLIVLNFLAAWAAEDMAKAEKMQVMGNHKAIGITILLLTVVRIGWKLAHKAPPFEPTLKPWEITLAKATHFLFYVLMLAIPLSGWGMVSVGGNPVGWFGMFNIPALPVGSAKATGELFYEAHELLATGMLILFALHVVGALKHMVIDRDSTMARMSPFSRKS